MSGKFKLDLREKTNGKRSKSEKVKQMNIGEAVNKRSASESWELPLHSPRFLNKFEKIQFWGKNYKKPKGNHHDSFPSVGMDVPVSSKN